jgi:hypothetical protein
MGSSLQYAGGGSERVVEALVLVLLLCIRNKLGVFLLAARTIRLPSPGFSVRPVTSSDIEASDLLVYTAPLVLCKLYRVSRALGFGRRFVCCSRSCSCNDTNGLITHGPCICPFPTVASILLRSARSFHHNHAHTVATMIIKRPMDAIPITVPRFNFTEFEPSGGNRVH